MESVDLDNKSLDEKKKRSLILLVLITIATVGLTLRLKELLDLRSLWLDEIALYNQIRSGTYLKLFLYGVGGNQGAPALYLLLTRLSLHTLSPVELATRFVAFSSGIISIAIFLVVAIKAFKDTASRVIACLLFASAPPLIHYSAEGKHYMLETCVCLAIILFFLRFESGKTSLTKLFLFGLGAVWCAHTAPFVLCACGIVVLSRYFRARDYRSALIFCGASAGWVISFWLHASTNMRNLLHNKSLYTYWNIGLAPWDQGFAAVLAWGYETWLKLIYILFINPISPEFRTPDAMWWLSLLANFILFGVALGLVQLWQVRSPVAPYLTSLFAVVFSMAVLRLAPFSSRLVLYLHPSLLLCLSAFIAIPVVSFLGRPRSLKVGLAILLFAAVGARSMIGSFNSFFDPQDKNDIKAALQFLKEERNPVEPLIMRNVDFAPFAFYATRMGVPWGVIADNKWSFSKPRATEVRLTKRIQESPTHSVWVISVMRATEAKELVRYLEEGCCTVVKRHETEGSLAALITLSDPPKKRPKAQIK